MEDSANTVVLNFWLFSSDILEPIISMLEKSVWVFYIFYSRNIRNRMDRRYMFDRLWFI